MTIFLQVYGRTPTTPHITLNYRQLEHTSQPREFQYNFGNNFRYIIPHLENKVFFHFFDTSWMFNHITQAKYYFNFLFLNLWCEKDCKHKNWRFR